jgi:hypothetical protein
MLAFSEERSVYFNFRWKGNGGKGFVYRKTKDNELTGCFTPRLHLLFQLNVWAGYFEEELTNYPKI